MTESQCVPKPSLAAPHVELRDISKTFPDVAALQQLSLVVRRGEFFSLLGPSGCGKTTTLRLVAGLDCLSSGEIYIDEALVSSPSYFVPPERRGVGIVFQDYALFPHMTAAGNIGFGLYGRPKGDIARRVGEMLDLVGLAESGMKYPHELSGGQKQRVALARALAPAPKVILLDEPFSNLDAELRVQLRHETKEILRASGSTVILVTHDQEEAFSLSDRVGLLNAGRLEQVATPYDMYHHPATRFVSDFVGRADYLKAKVRAGVVESAIGSFYLPESSRHVSGDVDLLVRPDDVAILEDEQGSATVTDVRFLGAHAQYTLRLDSGEVLHSHGLSAHLLPACTRVSLKVTMRHTVVFARGS